MGRRGIEGSEGFIRFRYRPDPPVAAPTRAGSGGIPTRCENLGCGALSPGQGAGVCVTASQRIAWPRLDEEDLAEITTVTADWTVAARGTQAPSSESPTRGAVHRAAGPRLFDGNAPELRRARRTLAPRPPTAP